MESSRYISDLKQDILKMISDLNPMVKTDKIALSRIYETLTGKSIRKDESREITLLSLLVNYENRTYTR